MAKKKAAEPEAPKKQVHPAVEAWRKILDSISTRPGAYTAVMDQAFLVERYMVLGAKAEPLLAALRQYFLDTTGEESQFVKKIDEILAR